MYSQAYAVLEENIWPAIQEYVSHFANALYVVYEEAFHLATINLQHFVGWIKTLEPDFARFGQAVSKIAKKFNDVAQRWIEYARKELVDFKQLVSDQLAELPGWDVIRERLQSVFGDQWYNDYVANVLLEVFKILEDTLPTEESKLFIKSLKTYLDMVINGDESTNSYIIIKSNCFYPLEIEEPNNRDKKNK